MNRHVVYNGTMCFSNNITYSRVKRLFPHSLNFDIIRFFHGSNVKVPSPSLDRCKEGRDLGRRFYTTKNERQAQDFAEYITNRLGKGVATVNEYEFDDDILKDPRYTTLNLGNAPTEEWVNHLILNRLKGDFNVLPEYLRFVDEKKMGRYLINPPSLTIGLVADGKPDEILEDYLHGKISLDETIERLNPNLKKEQWAFGDQSLLNKFKYIKK